MDFRLWLLAFEDPLVLSMCILAIVCVIVALWPSRTKAPPIALPLQTAHWETTDPNWIGRMGEVLIGSLMASEGWLQVHSKYSGNNGIDAIFVRALSGESWNALYENGSDEDASVPISVRVLEIKANTSAYQAGQISRVGVTDGLDSLIADSKTSERMKALYQRLKADINSPTDHVRREFCHIDLDTAVARFWHIAEDEVPNIAGRTPYKSRKFELTWVQAVYFATRPNGQTTSMTAQPSLSVVVAEDSLKAA